LSMHFPPRQEPVTDSSKYTAADVRVTDQKLRVCDICGAFLSVYDSDRRLADHFGGKLHLGYMQIREKLADLLREPIKGRLRKMTGDQKNEAKILTGKVAKTRSELVAVTEIVHAIVTVGAETVIGIRTVIVVMTVIEKETVIQGADIGRDQGTVLGIMIDQGVMIGTSNEADEKVFLLKYLNAMTVLRHKVIKLFSTTYILASPHGGHEHIIRTIVKMA
ncbi:hypothetical protein M8C21_004377, partial [Ambrosia artemisiifolia]